MRRAPLLLLIFLLPTQLGCIWDRDTLAAEITGRQDAIKVIAGWFDRYPPQYYLMRLERVTKELQGDPTNLALYDDAAVASDRLGNPDAAIGWITKKQTHLHLEPKDAPQPNHHYRTLANLGTFHAHRWIKHRLADPAEIPPLDDLQKAEKLIAQAITENPDAHFGREKYQLMVIQWLLTESSNAEESPNPLTEFVQHPREHQHENSHLADLGLPDLVEGISGMIELGAGWQSIDLFSILNLALMSEGRSQPAAMAFMRVENLVKDGSISLHPDSELAASHSLPRGIENSARYQIYYTQITEAADQRHQSRTSYLLTRLNRGEHPDTHSDFWNNWDDPSFPTPPSQMISSILNTRWEVIVAAICLVLVAILVLIRLALIIRSRRQKNSTT